MTNNAPILTIGLVKNLPQLENVFGIFHCKGAKNECFHGNLRGPPKATPPQEIAGPLFWGGGGIGGVPLGSHDVCFFLCRPKRARTFFLWGFQNSYPNFGSTKSHWPTSNPSRCFFCFHLQNTSKSQVSWESIFPPTSSPVGFWAATLEDNYATLVRLGWMLYF